MIDYNRPIQTRDGRKVEIFADDLAGDYPLAGAVTCEDGRRLLRTWTSDGCRCEGGAEHPLDLVNAPRTITSFLNVYKRDDGEYYVVMHNDREVADRVALPSRVACHEATIEVSK